MKPIKKKLIEVALPLEAINKASAREKSIRHGHPSTLHLWWARRPLAAARAVIFAQMVDDPSSYPDLFKTEKAQEKERQRLFKIIEDLVKWENTTNEEVLQKAREEIWQSWRRTCAENADHPRAKELFNRNKLPAFHDPFAGGGALPLEAHRLGLEAYASDLNPVAVLINKAMIEIPPKFANKPPFNPEWQKRSKDEKTLRTWKGAQGLAEDVRYYGKWMHDEVEKRIGNLYPKIKISAEMAEERPDLKPYVGKSLTIIAWLWARTVKSPNPAFKKVDVPLISTYMLSTKAGNEVYIEPIIENNSYRFTIKIGKPTKADIALNGTKLSGSNFRCLMSGTPIMGEYIKSEGKASHIGTRMIAIIAEGDRTRIYLPPTDAMESIARQANPEWKPDVEFFQQALGFRVGNYGMTKWSDLFTPRQLLSLTTFSDLVKEARELVKRHTLSAGLIVDDKSLSSGGLGNTAYADAIAIYLAFAISKIANIGSTIASWMNDRGAFRETFAMQAIRMTWEFVEANPLAKMGGSFETAIDKGAMAIEYFPISTQCFSSQADAATQRITLDKIVSTDPPYYDNIGFADLSDFFYVWLRHSLKSILPDLFTTLTVPKAEELVATPGRHQGKVGAETFFLNGMTQAMHRIAEQVHPAFPITIFYAFKQSEGNNNTGISSTGWETFLGAVINAGFAITGTWPMRTESAGRIRAMDSNALASSIILVCRPRSTDAPTATKRDFLAALKSQLPLALTNLQRGNIAPVDLAQAAIGPGMEIYCHYTKVLETDGSQMSIRSALQIINQELDVYFAQQDEAMDQDTRFCLTWFEQYGIDEGPFDEAVKLARAKNSAIQSMADDGILKSKAGKVRLVKREELCDDWDPGKDKRLTIWECTQHLIRRLNLSGEEAAAQLAARLGGGRSEEARALAYRLYSICEKQKRTQDALDYNSLVIAWPEITRMAMSTEKKGEQGRLF